MSKGKKRPVVLSDSDDDWEENLDEELIKLVPTPSKKTKPDHVSTGSDSSESDDDWWVDGKAAKNKAKKKKPSAGAAVARTTVRKEREESVTSSGSHDAFMEEGELSDVEEVPCGHLSSSLSATDSDSEGLEFDDGLDENLIGDTEDRTRLAGMTEAEREQEMFMRYEKRDAMKTRLEIRRKLKLARKKEQRQNSKVQRSLRPKDKRRNEDKTKSRAIDELRAKRQARKASDQQALLSNKELLKAADVFSSDETSGSSHHSQSDEEVDRSLADLKAVRYVSAVDEVAKVKLSRYRLEKWIHMPFFENAIKGCFVKIGIGNHDGRPVYRLAEIIGVQETTKVYGLGSTKTNKGLKLRHGLQERLFRIEYVSNSNVSITEFNHWKKELEKADLPLPTVEAIEKKSIELDKAKAYEFTDEQIDQIIHEKEKFRKNPRNYAMTKNKLLREKALATEEGNTDKMETLKKQLEDLEERAEELDKQRTKGLTAISYINERNRQNNLIRAEEALKEEFANKKETDDPFTRRKCMPTLVTLSKDKPSEDKESTDQVDIDDKKDTILTPCEGKKSMSVSSAAEHDDLFSAHDFDILIDLPSSSNGSVSVATPRLLKLPVTKDESRRSLNLSDYKKRKGLI